MNAPDQELLHAFGNEDIYADKLAGRAELVARLAMGLIGYGSGRTELHRQRSLQVEAEAMNAAFEHMQAMKLQQAEAGARHSRAPYVLRAPIRMDHESGNGLGGKSWDALDQGMPIYPVGLDEGMVRMASVAYDVGADMAKEALSIQPLVDAAKNIFGKVGPAATQTMGKVVGATAQGPKMPTLASTAQKITGGLPAAPKPPPALGQVAPTLAGGAAAGGGILGSLGGIGQKVQQGLQQSGVTSLRGAAMTAGGLALGGMAIKGAVGGAKKGLDVMSREATPQQYGTQQFGGSRVPFGVNDYGQPDLRTPFM